MRSFLLMSIALMAALPTGCGKSRPALTGGKPVRH